ncbi:glycosyltransferase family 2 protein [Hansschlegelia sp. KR7-227]|uniref:glycosyltransferase family 2 protein n=1 Tax=Hansschlegelia sp. KR7-227 TaxID=3400914 RepID=UPI003BFBC124
MSAAEQKPKKPGAFGGLFSFGGKTEKAVVSAKAAPVLAPVTATRSDIERCFFLFFGETNVSEERIAKRLDANVRSFMSFCMRQDKFTAAVIDPIATGATLPHYAQGSMVPRDIAEWFDAQLGLSFVANELLPTAPDWRSFFLGLMLDERFNEAVKTIGVEPTWPPRLRKAAAKMRAVPAAKQTAIQGSVDGFEGAAVRGWAFDAGDRGAPLKVEVFGDNLLLGTTEANLFRRDVQEHFGGDGMCGFELMTSPKLRQLFPAGSFTVSVRDWASKTPIGGRLKVELPNEATQYDIARLRAEIAALQSKIGQISAQLPRAIRQATVPVERFEDVALDWHFISAAERRQMNLEVAGFAYRPRFSVVMPTYQTDPGFLRDALNSVRRQIYPHFEIVVSDGGSRNIKQIQSVVDGVFGEDDRLVFKTSETRLGISANTNVALEAATGDYVVFLDHDDVLTDDALFAYAKALQTSRYKLIYSDEDRFTDKRAERVHHTPFFKPDFDDELLLTQNYICHLVAVRADVAKEVGPLNSEFDGAQDHDYMLRVAEKVGPGEVLHVPQILYHWRTTEGSMSTTDDNIVSIENRIAKLVTEHLARTGQKGAAENEATGTGKRRQFTTRIVWQLPDPAPGVSIIIPTRDRNDLTGPCITSIQATLLDYPGDVEILIMDNDSEELQTERYLQVLHDKEVISRHVWSGAFNWSAINNEGARKAKGEVLVFLNNDTLVQSSTWLTELASLALRPKIGAVGAKLLYEDGMFQHAGVLIGMGGVAGHDGLGSHSGEGGYFGRNQLVRKVSAVTGACLAVRKSVFDEMNGFDEITFGVAFNDVDFCLRLQEAGYSNLYTPHATLFHFESKSRGFDTTTEKKERHKREREAFLERWGHVVNQDPFYNVNFFRHGAPFRSILRV